MEILCPNFHGKKPTVMVLKGYSWSYKNGKPVKILYEFRCLKCGAVIRTELPIIYYKEGRL